MSLPGLPPPLGGKHNSWKSIITHTAKCDICHQHNVTVMQRCNLCNMQFCRACIALGKVQDAEHIMDASKIAAEVKALEEETNIDNTPPSAKRTRPRSAGPKTLPLRDDKLHKRTSSTPKKDPITSSGYPSRVNKSSSNVLNTGALSARRILERYNDDDEEDDFEELSARQQYPTDSMTETPTQRSRLQQQRPRRFLNDEDDDGDYNEEGHRYQGGGFGGRTYPTDGLLPHEEPPSPAANCPRKRQESTWTRGENNEKQRRRNHTETGDLNYGKRNKGRSTKPSSTMQETIQRLLTDALKVKNKCNQRSTSSSGLSAVSHEHAGPENVDNQKQGEEKLRRLAQDHQPKFDNGDHSRSRYRSPWDRDNGYHLDAPSPRQKPSSSFKPRRFFDELSDESDELSGRMRPVDGLPRPPFDLQHDEQDRRERPRTYTVGPQRSLPSANNFHDVEPERSGARHHPTFYTEEEQTQQRPSLAISTSEQVPRHGYESFGAHRRTDLEQARVESLLAELGDGIDKEALDELRNINSIDEIEALIVLTKARHSQQRH